ncbi:hypothetical protein ACIBK9_17325 [Nonomuraea sp. NPDC050227]|uniref:hypothetical protein n=1 Tax=Nonomuraea sp. NPDC050227 TaxID=3364360 RepID=UPI0037B0EEB8
MKRSETMAHLPEMTLQGTLIQESGTRLVMEARGQLMEVPARSLLKIARADEEVELTLAPDTRLLMHGMTMPLYVLVESDVFDELPKPGSEEGNGGTCICNCNCNCVSGGGNCNCNCNCAAILTELECTPAGVFRRAWTPGHGSGG